MRRIIISCFLIVGTMLPLVGNAAQGDWNLRTAPISDMFGIVNVELDYAFHPKWSGGPVFYTFDFEISDTTFETTAGGLRVNYHFNEALESGWIASLIGSWGNFDISEVRSSDGLVYSTTSKTRVYTALIGYQMMGKHFNMTTGVGASYLSLPETTPLVNGVQTYPVNTSFLSGVVPNVEFTIGWRF